VLLVPVPNFRKFSELMYELWHILDNDFGILILVNQSIVVNRPELTTRAKQHLCMDKGYDYPEVYELLEDYGYICLRGEYRVNCKRIPRYRARHWIVERTRSWMNRFRRLLIRWEKKVENHIAMLHFACTCITYRTYSRTFRIGSKLARMIAIRYRIFFIFSIFLLSSIFAHLNVNCSQDGVKEHSDNYVFVSKFKL